MTRTWKTAAVAAALALWTGGAYACTDAREMALNQRAGALYNAMNRLGTPAAGRAYMQAMAARKACIDEQVSGFGGHGNLTSLSEADYAAAAKAYPLAVDPIPPPVEVMSDLHRLLKDCVESTRAEGIDPARCWASVKTFTPN